MKKIVSVILTMSMILGLMSLSASAAEQDNYEEIKAHVSKVYGIPLDIVNTLDEEKVRSLDIDDNQVISTCEEYINFVTDKNGDTIAISKSEAEYLEYASLPASLKNPNDASNSWMKVYLIIIDDGATLRISSTYNWLTEPRVIYNQHDVMQLTWENGTYVEGSAEGFYSYLEHGATPVSKDITGVEAHNPQSPKTATYAHAMNDSGVERNLFFHLMVRIKKDSGAGMERAWSKYGHQDRSINWGNVLSGGFSIASAFTLDKTLGVLAFVAGVATILGAASDYYEECTAFVYLEY